MSRCIFNLLVILKNIVILFSSSWFLAGTWSQQPLLERPSRLGLLLCCRLFFRWFSWRVFLRILPLGWRGSFQPAHHHFTAGSGLSGLDRVEGGRSVFKTDQEVRNNGFNNSLQSLWSFQMSVMYTFHLLLSYTQNINPKLWKSIIKILSHYSSKVWGIIFW